MARTVRNAKLDTRSARAKLPANKSGYWVPITRGFAVGYRKGPKGGVWLARLIEPGRRHETTLGPADDALDADGVRILDYPQAQAEARAWVAALDADEAAGPYTVDRCLDDYIADYKRRGGKALDRLENAAAALIRPPLGGCEIGELTAGMLRNWHAALAEAPARLRTRKNAATRNVRAIDLNDPDAVRAAARDRELRPYDPQGGAEPRLSRRPCAGRRGMAPGQAVSRGGRPENQIS